MVKNIMVQGIGSNSGKSVITKALCRYYKNLGFKVTSFKPVLVIEDIIKNIDFDTDIRMIASMQACKKELNIDNNPIQIIRTSEIGVGQLYINKQFHGEIKLFGRDTPLYNDLSADIIQLMKEAIKNSLIRLQKENEFIIIEGAGNPTDLGEFDLTNYYVPTLCTMDILLVTKLSSGGAAANLIGTYELLKEEIRVQVKGYILNDFFIGDKLVDQISKIISNKISIKCLGTFPHLWTQIKHLSDDEQIEILANAIGKQIQINF